MLVRCTENAIASFDTNSAIGQELHGAFGEGSKLFDITAGASYVVYAVAIRKGLPWYFIADDSYEHLLYPLPYASACFEEIDSRVSRCWSVGFRGENGKIGGMSEVLITFCEWARDGGFFERLIDGSRREADLFQRYKAFMDLEYPAPVATDEAEQLEQEWVMCPKCTEVWKADATLGMTRCPKCSARLLNPVYEAEKMLGATSGL